MGSIELKKLRCLYVSANPCMKILPQTLILGNNMSSAVTVSSLGQKIAILDELEQLKALAKKCENAIHISKIPLPFF